MARRPQGRGLVLAVACSAVRSESGSFFFFLDDGGGGGWTLILEEIGLASPLLPTLSQRLWLLSD